MWQLFLDHGEIGFFRKVDWKILYSEYFKGFLFVEILFKRRIPWY